MQANNTNATNFLEIMESLYSDSSTDTEEVEAEMPSR